MLSPSSKLYMRPVPREGRGKERWERMKKVFRVFAWIGAGTAGMALLGVLLFFLLIVAGLSPRLQTIWICSAMRTMSHKYLATAFFSEETIDRIMKENEVDDSGHDSELLSFALPSDSESDLSEHSVTIGDAAADALKKITEQPEPETEPKPVPGPDAAAVVPPEPMDDGETAGWIIGRILVALRTSEAESGEETEPEGPDGARDEVKTDPEEEDEEPEKEYPAVDEILRQVPALNTAAAKAALGAAKRAVSGDTYIAQGYDRLDGGLYLKAVSGLTWRGYVMLVADPTRVRLRDTSMQYECGENVMTMVKSAGAVAGINGGGFVDGPNYDSNGGTPGGLIIEEGTLVCPLTPDDSVYSMIGINRDGVLVLRHCTADWALSNGIVSAVSFAPFLVVNGEGMVKNGSGGWGIAPRTAIGQRETGEMLLLVIDGRQADWSIGCDLDVLQEVMLAEGAVNAAMLDGGSSTAMVHNGTYINRPSLGHERWINNCFVVMPES